MDPYRLNSPRLLSYLDSLPNKLDTYPTAKTKSNFSLILRRHLAPHLTAKNLPKDVEMTVLAPWAQDSWIPTTAYVALCALARDHLWKTAPEYHSGMFAVASEMFGTPLYRALFFMFGPILLARRAAKRWSILHQGTSLTVASQELESLTLSVDCPKNLFTEESLQSMAAAFCAIAEGSRGKDSTYTILTHSESNAQINIRWRYGA